MLGNKVVLNKIVKLNFTAEINRLISLNWEIKIHSNFPEMFFLNLGNWISLKKMANNGLDPVKF